MLLNTTLNVRKEHHNNLHSINMWSPFISRVLEELNNSKNPLCFIFIGDIACKHSESIDQFSHLVINVEDHPVDAVAQKRAWKYEDCFSRARDFLLEDKDNHRNKQIW